MPRERRAALFNDPQWDLVRSSCQLTSWQQQLGRLQWVWLCLVLRARHVHDGAELLSKIC